MTTEQPHETDAPPPALTPAESEQHVLDGLAAAEVEPDARVCGNCGARVLVPHGGPRQACHNCGEPVR
jgi:ribosomal protein S27AE